MPRKTSTTKTHPFTVTLPEQAVVMIDHLIGIGLHGSSRAEVARTLILSRLEQLAGPSLIPGVPQREH
jgi:Arc/MetJ-type ribon-helix-helix transcriptional regulator